MKKIFVLKSLKSKSLVIRDLKLVDKDSVDISIGNIVNYYQPQYEIHTMKVVGVEVLSRISFDGGNLLYPDFFIPYIVKSKQSRAYFLMVLEKALYEFHQMRNIEKLSVNVNVSALTVGIDNEISDLCFRYSYLPEKLTLELTEEEDYKINKDFFVSIQRVLALGVRISMDDFGKDSACLSNFVVLPFSEIKIDRFLVGSSLNNEKSSAVIRLCIALGEALGIQVVAEGIENIEMLDMMKNLGVNICQGYYLSKPVDINQLNKLVV